MYTNANTHTISFRVDSGALHLLTESACETRLSLGAEARRLLLSALHDETAREVLRELRTFRGELEALRADVATTLEALLLNLAHASPNEVETYLNESLRR